MIRFNLIREESFIIKTYTIDRPWYKLYDGVQGRAERPSFEIGYITRKYLYLIYGSRKIFQIIDPEDLELIAVLLEKLERCANFT